MQLTPEEPWNPSSDHCAVEQQLCVLSIRHLDQVIEEEEIAFENLHRHVAASKFYHYICAAIEFEDDLYNVLRGSHPTTLCDIDGNVLQGQDKKQLYPKSENSRHIHGISTG